MLRNETESSWRRAIAHLLYDCGSRSPRSELFQSVAAVAEIDRAVRPPDYLVRAAKAISTLGLRDRAGCSGERLGLRLAFDASSQPALGARSVDSFSGCLVYYAKRYALTLRLNRGRGGAVDGLTLGGEIARRDGEPLPRVPAYLLSERRVHAHAFSGRLGEFHLACRTRRPLCLRLLVDDKLLQVDLRERARLPVDLVTARARLCR